MSSRSKPSEGSSYDLDIPTPEVFEPLLAPARYKGAHGGRGSGKSHFFAELLVEKAILEPGLRAVCIREVQQSLKESVKRLVEDKIQALGVGRHFDVQRELIATPGGGIIVFQGMQSHTAESIKSLEGYDVAWVEEAQALSKRSLQLLRPTIRKPGSELWFSWNPRKPDDPVDELLRSDTRPARSVVVEANYTDNPWFPADLREEMEFDRGRDLDDYGHVWLGGYLTRGDAQVLRGRCKVRAFEPQAGWDGPYFGADWGFSVDPTALIKCWIGARTLYIGAEAYGHQVEIDNLPALFDRVPGSREHVIRSDSARPETISYLQRHGFPRCVPADKWPGSVEDGVEHLRSYEQIVIHPDCVNAIREARDWSWKVDRKTDDVLPELAPGNDHIWDATRYALSPLIKRRQKTRAAPVNIMGR